MYSTISQWIGFYFSEMGLLLSFKSPGNLQDCMNFWNISKDILDNW